MTDPIHMPTPNQDAPGAPIDGQRNDYAIDPDTPDHELGQGTQYEERATTPHSATKVEQGENTPQKSNGSAFVPDYEPAELAETLRTPQPTEGEDGDINTDAG